MSMILTLFARLNLWTNFVFGNLFDRINAWRCDDMMDRFLLCSSGVGFNVDVFVESRNVCDALLRLCVRGDIFIFVLWLFFFRRVSFSTLACRIFVVLLAY